MQEEEFVIKCLKQMVTVFKESLYTHEQKIPFTNGIFYLINIADIVLLISLHL